MNEILFLFHILLVIGFGLAALRMGRQALSAWIALQAVLANLFVIKQTCLFGFHVTCSDVFAIGGVFGLNLLREYYGSKAAQRALGGCFLAMVFFVAMAQIHLLYAPSPLDTTHAAFSLLLTPSPRLLFASLLVFFVVQKIDLRLFGWMRKRFGTAALNLRTIGASSLTQLLDTVLFSLLGLWGLVASLSDIILVSFLVKLAIIGLMTPLTHFSKRFIQGEVDERI